MERSTPGHYFFNGILRRKNLPTSALCSGRVLLCLNLKQGSRRFERLVLSCGDRLKLQYRPEFARICWIWVKVAKCGRVWYSKYLFHRCHCHHHHIVFCFLCRQGQVLLQGGRCCHRADRLASRLRLHQHHACGSGGLNNPRGPAATSPTLSFLFHQCTTPWSAAACCCPTQPPPERAIIRTNILCIESKESAGGPELFWAMEGLDLYHSSSHLHSFFWH